MSSSLKNFKNAFWVLFQNLKNRLRAFHSHEDEKDKPGTPYEDCRPPERAHGQRVYVYVEGLCFFLFFSFFLIFFCFFLSAEHGLTVRLPVKSLR